MTSYRALAIRCGLATVVVAILAAVAFALGGETGSVIGCLLAFVGVPLASFVCARGVAPLPVAALCAAFPLGAAMGYRLQPTGSSSVIPNEVSIVASILVVVVLMLMALADRRRDRVASQTWLLLLGFWWAGWAMVLVTVFPLPESNSLELDCITTLKLIGGALQADGNATTNHLPPVSELVASGKLRQEDARCPLGGGYVAVNEHASSLPAADRPAYLCLNHPDAVILVTRDGRVKDCVHKPYYAKGWKRWLQLPFRR